MAANPQHFSRNLVTHRIQLSNQPLRTLNYFFYVAFAVGMASLAAYLVRVFAPTAAGSGIAEVKVILGGFGIRNFLSGWTLLIKVSTIPFLSLHLCEP
jgi:H+/Cl- antiporter ClcA